MTAGGRVLAVTALGPTIAAARDQRLRRRRPDLVAGHAAPHRHRRRRDHGALMIPRYSLPEMTEPVHRRGQVRRLARGRDPRDRGVGRARRRAEGSRGRGARARRLRRRRDRGARADHRARRRRVRRRGPGARRPAGRHLGALRPHVERRGGHRALAAADPGRGPADRGRDHARRRDHQAGARVPRHADGRAHARHPRRADDVRREARALGAADPPRHRAAAPGHAR